MQFFVPQFPPGEHEVVYAQLLDAVKDQMRMPITGRRIHAIKYVHDKKTLTARVGERDPQQGRFEVLAIFESKPYVLATRTPNGGTGVMILVDSNEITEVEEFAVEAA